MDNLEHGWLRRRLFDNRVGKVVGYCEWCGEPIREDDNFKKIDGDLICQDCNEARFEQYDRE
jgi:formylmethanofuran dehydrogenase subunit E